jgi:hypothetical protein
MKTFLLGGLFTWVLISAAYIVFLMAHMVYTLWPDFAPSVVFAAASFIVGGLVYKITVHCS